MPFLNPLDKVPKIPRDWANHIAYGGVLGIFMWSVLDLLEIDYPQGLAALGVLIVAALKKAIDFVEEDESAGECIGKALVTAAWPASMALVAALGN